MYRQFGDDSLNKEMIMKKTVITLLLCVLLTFCLVSCTSYKAAEEADRALLEQLEGPDTLNASNTVEYPAYYFGESIYRHEIHAHHAGNVIFGREDRTVAEDVMNIPEEFSNGTVIISYTEDYFFKGKKRTGSYELIYFNFFPEKKFQNAIPERPMVVGEGDELGVAMADTGVILRCKRPDEHLVSCARRTPKYDGKYWYFGVETLDVSIPKLLLFQPVTSRSDEITFHTDGLSETLEEITFQSDSVGHPCSYPNEGVRIKTQLSAYPEITGSIRSTAELYVRQQNFVDYYGNLMNLDVTVDVDGLTWHFMYPNYFLDYLTDEYTLGDDIYLYGNICYSLDGELYLYGRDFQQYDPDDEVDAKMKEFTYANFGDNSLR